MTAEAGSHATPELLSAYLDRELGEPEAVRLEAHLEACEDCHGRLEGLRSLIANLRRLESRDPSPELELAVARRIALEGKTVNLFDRLESRLSVFNRQSALLGTFAIVIALGAIVYLFSVAVEQSQRGFIPVVLNPENAETVQPPGESAERRELAGRTLVRRDEAWIEEGLSAPPARRLRLDSNAGRELLREHPELEELSRLRGRRVVEVEGEVVEIE